MTSVRAWAQGRYLRLLSRELKRRLEYAARTTKRESSLSDAIHVIARFQRTGGITNGALHNLSAFQEAGFVASPIDVSSAIRDPLRHVSCPPGGVRVVHCDATQFPLFAWPLRRDLSCRKLVGYFAWELAAPPGHWPNENVLWDEIWTPSHFAAGSLAKHYQCPIHVVPHVVLKTGKPRVWRKGEEALTFLTMADARSSFVRKNPRGALKAFQLAFPSEQDVRLVVKLQIARKSRELDGLLYDAARDPRVEIIAGTLEREHVERLFQRAHVYVSLHRAEGFGLPLLEARTQGLATIATGYSGNLDFMSEADSLLVPYQLVEMTDDEGVYGRVTWASPDIPAAAESMRRLYDDSDVLAKIAIAGWEANSPERQMSTFRIAARNAGLDRYLS